MYLQRTLPQIWMGIRTFDSLDFGISDTGISRCLQRPFTMCQNALMFKKGLKPQYIYILLIIVWVRIVNTTYGQNTDDKGTDEKVVYNYIQLGQISLTLVKWLMYLQRTLPQIWMGIRTFDSLDFGISNTGISRCLQRPFTMCQNALMFKKGLKPQYIYILLIIVWVRIVNTTYGQNTDDKGTDEKVVYNYIQLGQIGYHKSVTN